MEKEECAALRLFGHWPCGLMDKALVFGTKDCRFESCLGQFLDLGHMLTLQQRWIHFCPDVRIEVDATFA